MKRVGLLGGAFNPLHNGHLRLAELALRHLGLEEVRFIPTALSPHKPTPAGPGPEARLRLLEEALGATGRPFRVEALEVERGGASYTVDTLEALHRREPGCAWIFLMGTDQMAAFGAWRRPERILELASLAVTPRPGFPDPQPPPILAARLRDRWSGRPGEWVWLPGTGLELASTDLREDLRRGGLPEGLPPQVTAAILRENHYR
jgi:nicotinate-nucleotide adenylyltransferase